jgi:hypothetical protein
MAAAPHSSLRGVAPFNGRPRARPDRDLGTWPWLIALNVNWRVAPLRRGAHGTQIPIEPRQDFANELGPGKIDMAGIEDDVTLLFSRRAELLK